jgi:hypothetical protein
MELRLPAGRLHTADLRLKLQLNIHEAGSLGVVDQIALIEVDHRIIRGHGLLILRADLARQLVDRLYVEAEQRALALSHAEAVDRLEDRDAPAWPQHTPELAERTLLVGDVDQH